MAAAHPSAEAVGTHEAASSVGSSSTDSVANFVNGDLQTISLVTRADTIQQEILDLAAIRNNLNQQKKQATKAFRNLDKTRKRLKKKSAALSTKDLVDVLALRVSNDKKKREEAARNLPPVAPVPEE